MDSKTMDVRWMLEQWGRWCHHKRGINLDYPSATPFERLRGSSVPDPQISDDLGCWIDALISALAREHPREAAAVALTHICRLSSRKVAGRMKCSQKSAQSLLERGEFWVEGRMGGG